MDKELLEKLDKLLEKMVDSISGKTGAMFKEALSEPCKIHIDNDGKGTALAVEGHRLSLLITLAGAEKGILKQLNCSTEEFEFIKNVVGTREAGDNE